MKKILDICISQNSNLVHIEEKETGRNVATITMKGSTKEQREDMALALVEAYNATLKA